MTRHIYNMARCPEKKIVKNDQYTGSLLMHGKKDADQLLRRRSAFLFSQNTKTVLLPDMAHMSHAGFTFLIIILLISK